MANLLLERLFDFMKISHEFFFALVGCGSIL